jgi:hypothetical protein
MLTELYLDELPNILVSRSEFHPFPTSTERAAWEGLSDNVKQQLIAEAVPYHRWHWPALPATLFMEYQLNGNRRNYETPYFARRSALAALVTAECAEGKGRHMDDIINGIWCICEESSWCIPAHTNLSNQPVEPLPDIHEPVIDLFAAETGGLMAWIHYLLHIPLNAVSPRICQRIQHEVNSRILVPYLQRNDFWWMGLLGQRSLNNWTPWCISNCLTTFLIMEEQPELRVAAVAKSMRCLDKYLNDAHPDGGCDEGTSYWSRAGGSVFDCLELLALATGGRINIYDHPLIADIGRYLYRAFIDGRYFVNFADGGARVNICADLVYRYGKRIQDSHLRALGAYAHQQEPNNGKLQPDSLLRKLPSIFNFVELDSAEAEPPYVQDVWLPHLQFMAARSQDRSKQGLYVAAKGGHNAESHNHNDVGQFVVYMDGKPVIVDVGVETYTAQTFSDRRYDLWTMQSAYHNLPTINGIQQQDGRQFTASQVNYQRNAEQSLLAIDISSAYPEAAGIDTWQRQVRLIRASSGMVEIVDTFRLREAGSVMLSLMTPHAPTIELGKIVLPSAGIVNKHPVELAASCERITQRDARLTAVWGECLYRLLLQPRVEVITAEWRLEIVPL